MGLKIYLVITLYILLVNGWLFESFTMRNNQVDLLYQHALKYGHHAENYKQSILEDITPFGLRLKKKAAINYLLILTLNGMEYLRMLNVSF